MLRGTVTRLPLPLCSALALSCTWGRNTWVDRWLFPLLPGSSWLICLFRTHRVTRTLTIPCSSNLIRPPRSSGGGVSRIRSIAPRFYLCLCLYKARGWLRCVFPCAACVPGSVFVLAQIILLFTCFILFCFASVCFVFFTLLSVLSSSGKQQWVLNCSSHSELSVPPVCFTKYSWPDFFLITSLMRNVVIY